MEKGTQGPTDSSCGGYTLSVVTHDHLLTPSRCSIVDAYFVLSDSHRRKQYDVARKSQNSTSRTTWESTSNHHAEANTVFGNVFEELLRPEVENPTNFYGPFGMASGAVLGFICGGLPGAVMVTSFILFKPTLF